MKILLLGSGGREHALAWKISQSKLCSGLFIAPGNAGTSLVGKNVTLQLLDFKGIRSFCIEQGIEMMLVGPEEPLVKGIVDYFKADEKLKNIVVIGPSGEGAQLEGSKSFAKSFMFRHNVPTAAYREFDLNNFREGLDYIDQHSLPVVLKADGLAAGKGVLICNSKTEALAEFELMIQKGKFGEAGKKVVVESFLEGIELSVFVLTDGKDYIILPEAKDYKRIGEGDTGLNTGGMGAISPVPFATREFMQQVEDTIIRPTIEGIKQEGISYLGFVFFGLIKVGNDPYCIEYNCRLGDPETEVVIPRLQNDLVELFMAASDGTLQSCVIQTDNRTACTMVAVSGGYPGDFNKGYEITGLQSSISDNYMVFHAATLEKQNKVTTNGGRVLCVTSFGDSVSAAVSKSEKQLQSIHFENMYYRRDIGFEFE